MKKRHTPALTLSTLSPSPGVLPPGSAAGDKRAEHRSGRAGLGGLGTQDLGHRAESPRTLYCPIPGEGP